MDRGKEENYIALILYTVLGENEMVLYVTDFPIINIEKGADMILRVREISIKEAKSIVNSNSLNGSLISAVSRQATADLLSSIFNVNIPKNRVQVSISMKDKLLAFVLNRKLPKGVVIININELEETDYQFVLFEPILVIR